MFSWINLTYEEIEQVISITHIAKQTQHFIIRCVVGDEEPCCILGVDIKDLL